MEEQWAGIVRARNIMPMGTIIVIRAVGYDSYERGFGQHNEL
jgi:hypothetical protein